MKLKGAITEVKSVEVDVSLDEIYKAAFGLSTDKLLNVIKNKVIKKMKENKPELDNAQLKWNDKEWEVYDYYDYHHNDERYKTLRPLTPEELELIEGFNKFAASLK